MVETKICYQLVHPDNQTPCFIEAGSRSCSDETCAVYEAIGQSTLARSLGPEAFREHVNNYLLHFVCRISNSSPNNEEYKQRMADMGR